MQAGMLLRNRYRIDAKLGEGGMGVVYRAHDSLLQRPVAIKTLSPGLFGAEGARRLIREAQSAAKLQHPHIVAIFDAVEEGGQFAIVMELVEGQTLRELLPVPLPRLIEITLQVLEGLQYAHGQGIVHRDIKPENIIITKESTAKLMDFGLARSEGRSRLTVTGMVVGTVAYLAPEQALGGQVDGRSDLYALGAVLYEAVAGRPPFESEDPISVITQHINVPPVAPHWHNPGVPPALENVILKLLAKDPARRYQSAREAADALGAVRAAAGTAVIAVPTGGFSVAQPEKLAGRELVERLGRSPLVGREADLTRLNEFIDRAITGQGNVVLLSGPLGIGKTRLIEEAATYARLRGVTVITGNAYESAPAYEPFARSLREVARGVDSETLAARLGEFAPELVGLIPELARQLPRIGERAPGSAEDRKSRLFAGVAHFLGAMAAQNPLLVVLDDMHFADAATVELLQHVARRSSAERVLLIVAYRLDDIPNTPAGRAFGQVIHALGREPFCTSLALRPLTEEQVVDLIRLLANHPQRPMRFGRRIYEVTEGNPYFIEEVIKGLFEQGTLYIKDGQWTTDFDQIQDYSLLEVPTSVQGAVETRLRTLGEQSRAVLTSAAVVGRQFSFEILLAVTGTEEAALLELVEEAMRAQLIREVRGTEEDVYAFAQPMLRQVLYEAIPRRRRRLLHRQVGETLERRYGGKPDAYLEALAWHFAEAEDAEKTLKYARLAARKAAAVFAHDDAARFLEQARAAAEELDRPQEQLELLEALADLRLVADTRERTLRAYEDALQFWKSLPGTTNADGARLYRKLGEIGTRWGVHNPKTREHITEGLRLLEGAPQHPEAVKLMIARAFDLFRYRPEAASDYRAAEESAQEAYRLAEAAGSLADMSAALDALASLYGTACEFAKALDATRKRVPIVETLNDPQERTDLARMLAWCHEYLGEFGEALKYASQVHELATRYGRFREMLGSMVDSARQNLLWDRWDEAERWCALNVETVGRLGVEPELGGRGVRAIRATITAYRGDRERARVLEAEMEGIALGHPGNAWLVPYLRVFVALARNDLDRAGTVLAEGLELATTPWLRLQFLAHAMRFAWQAEDWQYVDTLGREALDLTRRSGARLELALACRAVGASRRARGQPEEAEAFLTEAEALLRTLDCRFELARTLRELALLRRAQGRSEDATRLLQEALTYFETLQARPDVERTKALMEMEAPS